MNETSYSTIRVKRNTRDLFKYIKKFQKMTADDIIDELLEFWMRCHEP
jgi:hypothetical protein